MAISTHLERFVQNSTSAPEKSALALFIPPEEITNRLRLTKGNNPIPGIPDSVIDRVRKSNWFSIDGGRIYLEERSFPHQLWDADIVKVVDFDDCLMSATGWHKAEYRAMENFGINYDFARKIYDASKIKVPPKVIKEPRYTPLLNLHLLSTYRDFLVSGDAGETALERTLYWKDQVMSLVHLNGEDALDHLKIDPDIHHSFMNNSPAEYIYADFKNGVFPQNRIDKELRIIASRGNIEGPLGQVYKIHSSIPEQDPHMVVYTNDTKAETLLLFGKLHPQFLDKTIYVVDDNLSEVNPYLKQARDMGARKLIVVQVCHPDAKRKDDKMPDDPDYTAGSASKGDTVLKYFYAFSESRPQIEFLHLPDNNR